MSNDAAFGVRFTRSWVARYTGGLSAEGGDRRRSEIESDLYEQTQEGTEGVLGRCLRGIPADVGWRIRALRERARQAERNPNMTPNRSRAIWLSVKQHRSTALTILVIALAIMFGVGWLVDPDSSAGDRALGVVVLAAGVASGVGLWGLATGRLTVGTNQVLVVIGLVAAGAFAIGAMVDGGAFMVPVFGPLLVLALLALWLGVINRGLGTELVGQVRAD